MPTAGRPSSLTAAAFLLAAVCVTVRLQIVSAVPVLQLIETDGPVLLMLGGSASPTADSNDTSDLPNLQIQARGDRRSWDTGDGGAIPFPVAGMDRLIVHNHPDVFQGGVMTLFGDVSLDVPVIGLTGLTPTSVSFGGQSAYGELPFTRRLNPSSSFSVEVWMRWRSVQPGSTPAIVSSYFSCDGGTYRACGEKGYRLTADDSQRITFSVGGGPSVGRCDVTSRRAPLQAWLHIVAAYDADSGTSTLWVMDSRSPARRRPATSTCGYVPNPKVPFRYGGSTEAVAGNRSPVKHFIHTELAALMVYDYPLSPELDTRLGVFDSA